MDHYHWIDIERQPERRSMRCVLGPAVTTESEARQGATDRREAAFAGPGGNVRYWQGQGPAPEARHTLSVLACDGDCDGAVSRWVDRWTAADRR